MPKTMKTIMMMMMMIMTDPFTTNLVVKGPVAKGSVVKGAHPIIIVITIIIRLGSRALSALLEPFAGTRINYVLCNNS